MAKTCRLQHLHTYMQLHCSLCQKKKIAGGREGKHCVRMCVCNRNVNTKRMTAASNANVNELADIIGVCVCVWVCTYRCICVTCNVCPLGFCATGSTWKDRWSYPKMCNIYNPLANYIWKSNKQKEGGRVGRSAMLHLSWVVTVCGLIKSSHHTVPWYMPCREPTKTRTTTTPWRNCKVRVRVSDFNGASVCVCVRDCSVYFMHSFAMNPIRL